MGEPIGYFCKRISDQVRNKEVDEGPYNIENDEEGNEPCIWNGFKEAKDITDVFPTGNKSNRYFQIECPDCAAIQIYQVVEGNLGHPFKLYVIQSEHQC